MNLRGAHFMCKCLSSAIVYLSLVQRLYLLIQLTADLLVFGAVY